HAAILMMLHANGAGVERNLGVAIALACAMNGAAMEIDGRVKHLERLRRENWQGSDFSWCDDITSGMAQGICARLESRLAEARNGSRWESLLAKWSDKATNALLRRLDERFEAFVAARGEHEIERSGTAQLALVLEDEMALREVFLTDLETIAKGSSPWQGVEKATDADARLNKCYKAIQRQSRQAFGENWNTVRQDGIRQTQRAWLAYRDGWVAFLGQAAPRIPRDTILQGLTLRRVAQLEPFLPVSNR
ncbi:MAG: DUF1311 domain-containing protein, partial [Magnetococcales bacterium]|nr:DUF1311 domain-containing protein [Magnetococcales bacterium]